MTSTASVDSRLGLDPFVGAHASRTAARLAQDLTSNQVANVAAIIHPTPASATAA